MIYHFITKININKNNNITSSKQNFLHLNDFLILDNLDLNIMNIRNNLLNYIGNNINNMTNINQRINNFYNLSNSNLRNRYYSSKPSNHIFPNFIKLS